MKVKVSEATGPVLDWMVAKAIGLFIDTLDDTQGPWLEGDEFTGDLSGFRPSTDWSQGGPIIEREGLWARESAVASPAIAHLVTPDKKWFAYAKAYPLSCAQHCLYGETYLIATMRCFVASKLGDEVDVPEELTS